MIALHLLYKSMLGCFMVSSRIPIPSHQSNTANIDLSVPSVPYHASRERRESIASTAYSWSFKSQKFSALRILVKSISQHLSKITLRTFWSQPVTALINTNRDSLRRSTFRESVSTKILSKASFVINCSTCEGGPAVIFEKHHRASLIMFELL